MLLLYPEIKPYETHRIAVEPPHEIHVEECGNPSGIPVVFVHGGPGAGCEAYNRRFFDPELYRIILFDQRGAGRSEPHAELENNNTQGLVADMELIRERLGVERWVVFGGSWGSTLGLVYAETHPDRVMGLILRGIFLCRKQELDWFYQEGASRIFPEYWEDFLAPIPEAERRDLLKAYHRRLTGENELARMSAAKGWALWEARCATLRPNQGVEDHFSDPHVALALARIESHYFANKIFLEDNQILRDAGRLQGIPGVIVHGRYDIICPMSNAWDLHRAWPEAELRIVRDAGHSTTEPGIIDALVKATRGMARHLRPDQN